MVDDLVNFMSQQITIFAALPAPEIEPSDWSKVRSYKGCPQQNKAL